MSKTIKQIADELGVSKQAVFKKIKKQPLSTSLQQFISTIDGIVYISVDGEDLLKKSFNKKGASTVYDNQPTTDRQPVDGDFINKLITTLQENQELLRKELYEKNKQIEKLQKLLDQQQQLNLIDKKEKPLQIESKSHWWNKNKKAT